MEKNRSVIVKLVGSVLVLGVAAGVLFGLTGVLRDPAIEEATQAEKSSVASLARPPSAPVLSSAGPPAVTPQSDGGIGDETLATKDESDQFPQFDDEPHGS